MIGSEVVNAGLLYGLWWYLGEQRRDAPESDTESLDGSRARLMPIEDGIHGWLAEPGDFGQPGDAEPAVSDDAP